MLSWKLSEECVSEFKQINNRNKTSSGRSPLACDSKKFLVTFVITFSIEF